MPHIEIYIRHPGQELKEGKMEMQGGVMNRGDAENDARTRCAEDRSIWKIGYYAVDDSGAHKPILSYENPESAGAANALPNNRRTPAAHPQRAPAARPKAKKKKSLLSHVMDIITE